MLERVAKTAFLLGLGCLLVGAGLVIGWLRLPPVPQLDEARAAVSDWKRYWKSYLEIEPTKFVRKAPSVGAGVTLHVDGEAQPGVTVMSGIWGGKDVGLAMWSLDGRELHRWVARYSELKSHIPPLSPEETPTNDWDSHVDAWLLYPTGDAIFNYGGLGLVRMDRCNRVVWWLDYPTHHSLAIDDDGNFWAGGRKRALHREETARFPGLKPPYREDTLVKISPADGRILREISLLDAIYQASMERALFWDGQNLGELALEDPLHLNHVEPLTAALAPAFPMFAAGDLLVSLRTPSMILVIDGKTEQIKWAKVGTWFGQHDPHFRPDGRISIYDNRDLYNYDHAARGVPARASRILSLDPKTGEVATVFAGSLEQPFFTDAIGQHQYQPNGNLLIAESWGGRVFELTPQGKMVWEFVNRFADDRVGLIEWAKRYPASYADFPKECPAEVTPSGEGPPG